LNKKKRLDRLVLLLDTGSTPSVRSTAASQLGDIQRQHPEELYNLLSRVLKHLHSNSWETRVAAGQAIEAISKNVPQWDPPPPVPGSTPAPPKKKDQEENSKLLFDTFDIHTVIKKGTLLLANAGKDYDYDFNDLDASERLAMQKRDLYKRLGMATQFMDVDLISDADFISIPKGNVKKEVKEERFVRFFFNNNYFIIFDFNINY